jgi:hypothetical protein
MINVPEQYSINKFYQYAYRVKHNKYNNTYQAECPICREGSSSGKKRRCYFIPKKELIFCHNCGWSSKPLKWICKVSGDTINEIINEIKENDYDYGIQEVKDKVKPERYIPDIPDDCIELFEINREELIDNGESILTKDQSQIVEKCLKFIESRNLNIAVNRPKSLYVSFRDPTHKNRLIIPFYDTKGKIVFYQSRKVIDFDPKPRYISKTNGDKTIFGIDKVTNDSDYVFVFEGPFNSFFMKNGVAVGGIQDSQQTFTQKQQDQWDTHLRFYKRIFVLDSQWKDKTSLSKTEKLLDIGETVFIWPENIGKHFKDFNEIAIRGNLDHVSQDFVIGNSFSGLTGKIKLGQIKRII